jgi:hypothetical protein
MVLNHASFPVSVCNVVLTHRYGFALPIRAEPCDG